MGDGNHDFSAWYEEAHPKIVTSLLLTTGDLHAAQEAADEACARAYVRWKRVSEMDSPTGWTYRVAFNVLRRRWRRSTLEQVVLLKRPPVSTMPPPAGESWDAVRTLPLRQRTAVVLRFVGDLTEAEIAEVMGVTRSTVSATLIAAKRSLSRLLADDDDEQSKELDCV